MQRGQCQFGGFFQHLEQGFGGARGVAPTLLPITDGLQEQFDPRGEFCLFQSQALTDTQHEFGHFLPGFRFICGRLSGEICLGGGVQSLWIDPPQGQRAWIRGIWNC